MKRRFIRIFSLWRRARANWKTHYRLVIKNDVTHDERYSVRLTPKNIFVVSVISVTCLIALTTLLITFTPLRYYIPGYTNPNEYQKYKNLNLEIDSLTQLTAQSQLYLNNLRDVLSEALPIKVDTLDNTENKTLNHTEDIDPKDVEYATGWVQEKAGEIIQEITNRNSAKSIPINQRATIRSISILPPAVGKVTTPFDPILHPGIDIANEENTLITAIADGVVIFSDFTAKDGHTLIIQHNGGLLSIYKRNALLLKEKGDIVQSGDPIAKMGQTGRKEEGTHLHFELWNNNKPINPLSYTVIY